jgi:group I intron endonuclease
MKIEDLRALTPDEALLWPEPGTGFIYAIVSPSGKVYVGQTIKSIAQRFKGHCDPKRTSCRAVWKAIWKYGSQNMRLYMLYMAPESELNELERQAIVDCGSLSPKGYNLTTGGGACEPSIETLERLRAYGARFSEAVAAGRGNLELGPGTLCRRRTKGPANSIPRSQRTTGSGKKRTPEQIANRARKQARLTRIREKLRKRTKRPRPPVTEETRAKLRAACRRRPPPSEETKRKVSEALKGRKRSEETIAKMRQPRTPLSEETKRRVSQALKGRTVSIETRARMSAARLGMRYKKRNVVEPIVPAVS